MTIMNYYQDLNHENRNIDLYIGVRASTHIYRMAGGSAAGSGASCVHRAPGADDMLVYLHWSIIEIFLWECLT